MTLIEPHVNTTALVFKLFRALMRIGEGACVAIPLCCLLLWSCPETWASIPAHSESFTQATKNCSSQNTYHAEKRLVQSRITRDAQKAVSTSVYDDARVLEITQTTANYTYDALGIHVSHFGEEKGGCRYEGEENGSNFGVYYLRARYYKPETGRFWTMDTYEGRPGDPLSLHKYLYCQANPVNGVDPSGHDLCSLSISMTIGTSLDAMYNGGVMAAGNAMQATLMGIQHGKSSQQILTGYLLDTAIGVGVGIGIAKAAGLISEAMYGAEMEVSGSISTASKEAVHEAEAAVVEAAALQEGSKWYGFIDQFFPGNLQEGAVIYSTTRPEKIGGGLWATDARSLVRSGGSGTAYGAGTQSRPATTIYAYRVKGKTPAAFGGVEANHQYGSGGYSQYYVPKQGVGNVEYTGVTFNLQP